MKPTREDLLGAVDKRIPDIIALNLKVLFCGINPGLYSAATGYHFARPGNRFWKTLYLAGFTERLYNPSEQTKLLDLGLGITNIVERPSATAIEVTREEFKEGANKLWTKVTQIKPQYLAVVGIGAYRVAFNKPNAKVGLQPEVIGLTKIWLLPNTSGLNAAFSDNDFIKAFRELKRMVG